MKKGHKLELLAPQSKEDKELTPFENIPKVVLNP